MSEKSQPDLGFETGLWRAGLSMIAGIDEAGRGALAGPVAAGAVILPEKDNLPGLLAGVRDSKQMSPNEREYWTPRIKENALAWGVGFASAGEIDQIGILPATRLAAWRALEQLNLLPEHLLLDYIFLPDCSIPQTALVKGDQRSLSIAAASVLAKTARDACMVEYGGLYPGYDFARHKGYGTAAHCAALRALGPSFVHRRTFKASLVSRKSAQPPGR